MTQLGIPTHISPQEVLREKTLGGAISLCVKAAGLAPKEVQDAIKVDKSQFSRWESGGEGIVWPKFSALMDACGNDAPLLWMLVQRGYDLGSLHKRENEMEKELRIAREEIAALKVAREIERQLFRDLRAAA
jgi:hypothetical protein